MAISAGTVHAVAVALVLFALGLLLLARLEPWGKDLRSARLVRVALALKLAAAPVHLYFVSRAYDDIADYNLYHRLGAELAEPFRQGDFDVDLPHRLIGLGIVYVVTGVVYAIFGVSKTVGALVFSWIGFWGLYLFYRAARSALPDLQLDRYMGLLFFLPSLLFWPSTIGKDALMCFGLGLSSLAAARVLTRRRGGYALLATGLAASAAIRPHVALIFFLALSVAYLARAPATRSAGVPMAKLAGVAVLVFGGVVLTHQVERYLDIPDLRPGTVDDRLARTAFETGDDSPFAEEEETSSYRSSYDATSLRSPLAYPAAVFTVLFRPFPTETHNLTAFIASLEGLVLLLITLGSLGRVRAAARRWRHQPYLSLVFVYVAVFCYLFASVGNFGILARQRAQLLPFMLVLLAVPAGLPSKRRPTARVGHRR